jgi:hypothetical protein
MMMMIIIIIIIINKILFETANSLQTWGSTTKNLNPNLWHSARSFSSKTSRPAACPHLVPYSMAKGGSFRGVKAAGA